MGKIKIGKANFNVSAYDDRHLQNSSFINPPRFDKLTKVKTIFKNKKHNNYEKLYTILLARSDELNGDTKVSNEKIAKILKISTRQVVRCFNFLEKHKLIASIKKRYNFNGSYKTIRIIRVWVTYYKNRCRPLYNNVFKNDIRPGKEKDAIISHKIPLKFRVYKKFVPKKPCRFKKQFISMDAMDYSWLNLLKSGYINHSMSIVITQLETIASNNYDRRHVYDIMGYNKDFIFYKKTGIKKSELYNKNTTVKKESEFFKKRTLEAM